MIQCKIRNPIIVLLLPPAVAFCWYLYGMTHPTFDGYPGYIWGLDPMYPGVVVSLVLFWGFRILDQYINHRYTQIDTD